jgi:DNA invertase Pin-like site-specific DNA recombinase
MGPCASYARYSSDQQREDSIQDQQRKCHEAAARNGHVIGPDLEFADEAISGTKLHRDGLDKMLAAAAAGRFRVLYFHSLSRLARESVITMPLLKKLVYVDRIRVVSVTEGVDSDRDGWEMLATMFSLLHERYVRELGENVFRGQEGAVLAGFSVGDHCFGYSSVPIPESEKGRKGRHAKPRMRYVIDDMSAQWVKRIFNWFVVEMRSLRWIAQELNRLGAPKDHRSTKKYWHHQQVAALLQRQKYVGIWRWGEKKNVRNPLTGQVSQEERPEEDCQKWQRPFEHLRIISDELMAKALARLHANQEKHEHHRRPDGRLLGSRTGNSASNPRHLLSGLFHCAGCQAVFHVCGANGRYLRCPNFAEGVCTCKTQVRRDLAERLILQAIGQRIFSNPTWLRAVYEETLTAWRVQGQRRPGEIQEVDKALAEVDRKIARLVDSIEAGNDSQEVRARLGERRREREALSKNAEKLRTSAEQQPKEPTEEWVARQMTCLEETLQGGGPAAALALRNLVGGQITVQEIREPGRQRHYIQGRFVIRSARLLVSLGIQAVSAADGTGTNAPTTSEEVVVDFRDDDPAETIVDEVKALWDAGLTYREIAARVGWNRNIVADAVAIWHRRRGQEPPDGRSCKARLNRARLPEDLAEQAKKLFDQNLLMHEIAIQLGCCKEKITAAIKHWFRSRGQQVPDGRARRKFLPRKSSPDEDPQGPEQGPASNDRA